MRRSKMINMLAGVLLVACIAFPLLAEPIYTEPVIYAARPPVKKEVPLGIIGATGIKGRFYPGVVLKVESILPGAPAEGKLKPGQIIAGVNGVELQGLNPVVALGKALTEAEATDGRLVFDVKNTEADDSRNVVVTIPVLGAYSATWPLDCDKSKKIVAAAATYYATDPEFKQRYFADKSENGGIPSALACLFLLSTGDDQYLPVVKQYVRSFPKRLKDIGDHTWNNGYNGVACAEYYLRTGDASVMPILQYYCDNAKERQCFGCGWQHWGREIHPRYVAGGLMNPAGCQVLTSLLLARECGASVNEETLLGALKYWYRFAGHGTVPYGDHRAEGGLASNGKDGMAAAAMRVAMGAKGQPTIYERALKYLSMSTLTSYPGLIRGHGDNGRGDGIWRGIASAYMLDYKPDDYHAAMNDLRWWYDLSRRPSGALGMATNPRFDDVGSGAGVVMAYTAPLKTLRITGAPPSTFAKSFELPSHLWGRKADLAFLSIENNPTYAELGAEDPVHIPYYQFGSAYRKAEDLNGMDKDEILKNVFHKRYMIRAQAAKALRIVGAFDELETLLTNKDPRVRRAALDGIIDYRYWFHLGKKPMKAEQFTPGMVKKTVAMLRDPDEALYVVDGALSAMSCMAPETVGQHLDAVLPWAAHDEWWIRQSAFVALATAAREKATALRVLPTMLKMLLAENHTMPRGTMQNGLNRLLKRDGVESDTGQQILAAHIQAVRQRTIIPGPRAGEGEYDVMQSADVILKASPDNALELCRAISERFDRLSTAAVVTATKNLLTHLDALTDPDRMAVETMLYETYRTELVKRLKGGDRGLGTVGALASLASLKGAEVAWQDVGKNRAERIWRFRPVKPAQDDFLHPREKKRFREITLPALLENWFKPAFDDQGWQRGKAPIGIGTFEKRTVSFENRSAWGDGEFLLARTTLDVDSKDYDFYRISVLANQGFRIYLNGESVHTYVWWKSEPHYRKIMLGENVANLLKKGENLLAVRAGSEFLDGTHVGQIDVHIEGLREADLLADPAEDVE